MAYEGRQQQQRHYDRQAQQQAQYSRRPAPQAAPMVQYRRDEYGYDQNDHRDMNYNQGYNDRGYNQYYHDRQQYGYEQQYPQQQGQQWDQYNAQYPAQQSQQQYEYRQQQGPQRQYDTQEQYSGYDQVEPRQYQYDERYRTNGQGGQDGQNGQNGYDQAQRRPVQRRTPPNSRPGTSASRRPKQERILDSSNRESTKAMAWDNPFGVFPSKKDVPKKKKDSGGGQPPRHSADIPSERPSTSASSRIPPLSHTSPPAQSQQQDRIEGPPRPHTSNGPRPRRSLADEPPIPVNQYQSQAQIQDMPLRKKISNPPLLMGRPYPEQEVPHSATVGSFDLPSRPAPQRSASGPDPYGHQHHHVPAGDPYAQQQQQQFPRPHQREMSSGRGYAELDAAEQHNQAYEMPTYEQSPPRPNITHSTNQSQKPQPISYDSSNQKSLISPGMYDKAQYRASPTQSPTAQPQPDPDMPNFAAMAPGATEHVEKNIALKPSPSAYRKPTYGDASSRPPPIRPGLLEDVQPHSPAIQSPLDDFNFGLPDKSGAHHGRSRSDQQQQQQQAPRQQYNQPPNSQTFPPREGSRPRQQAAAGFRHPYNQPPQTHGQQRGGYDQRLQQRQNDYEQHLRVRQPLTRAQTEPVHQQEDHGYGYEQYPQPQAQQAAPYGYDSDPRNGYGDAGQRMAPQPGQQYHDQYGVPEPPRPRTASSSRPPAQRLYADPNMPMPRQNGLPQADRNHPVPIRPGLMQATAPAPAPAPTAAPPQMPMPVASGPHQQQNPNMARMQTPAAAQVSTPAAPPQPLSAKPAKTPVTIAELNRLRHACKERPNDTKLGLEFVQRLVEASVVLADEGGKLDAKTTSKNRERYVNDAYRIVKRLVAAGSPEAMFYLADCYGQGSLGLETNAKEAFQLYTSAAKIGHPQSAYRVAVCCELGPDGGGGTRRDHVKAVQFYKRAATLGDGPAMFKTGMILLKGLLGQPINRREGISWLKRAAERADEENPHALHELALLYENAQSTDVIIRDEPYAYSLFVQAANLGYKFSQHRLGSAYEYGTLGCQIDPRQSIAWYSRAAQQAEHQSEFALSGWYLTGSEPLLAQSDTEAYLWARKAAQSGLAKAEYAMGYYTEVGIGCAANLEEAKKWYFRAAAQLDTRAKERLEEIKRGSKRREKTRISRSNVGRQNEGECSVM